MKDSFRKVLALLAVLVMVLQYNVAAGAIAVYALDDSDPSVKTQMAVNEDEPEPEKASAEKAEKPERAEKAEKAEKPAEEPKTEKPKAEEPKAEEPADEPKADEPAAPEGADASDEASGTGSDAADADAAAADDADAEDGAQTEDAADPGDAAEPAEALESDGAEPLVTEPEGEEAEAEEAGYPATTLSRTVNGVLVTVSAPEGSLPEGVSLRVIPVSRADVISAVERKVNDQGRELTDSVAFDVTLIDEDGSAIQPRKPVTVTFNRTGLEMGDGGSVGVYRVSDDASSVTSISAGVATSDRQQFKADHFTIYVAGSTESEHGQSAEDRYVLKYGESVTLDSDIKGDPEYYPSDSWELSSGRYADLSGHTVTNTNDSSGTQTLTVTHTHRWSTSRFLLIPNRIQSDYFYITLLPREYTVTFMLQDAGEDSFSELDARTVHRGDSIADTDLPSLPDTKTVGDKEYTFFGWYTDETCKTKATFTNITSDRVVYAKYTTKATIRYNKNTSDSATVPSAVEGGAGTVVQIGTASRSGYSLREWNTAKDGSGTAYSPGQDYTMTEEGLTLYAQWDESNLNINYYLDYDYETTYDETWKVVSKPRGTRVELITDIPERPPSGLILRTYYVFRGWSTESGAIEPMYYPGDTFQTPSNRDHVDLYAVWGIVTDDELEPLTAESKTVTYNGKQQAVEGVSGGTPSGNHPGYVRVGGTNIYAYVEDIKASGTDAGSYSTPVTAPLYQLLPFGTMMRMNGAYMEITPGILTIEPLEITVDTEDGEQLYSGEALTAGGKVTFKDGETDVERTFTSDGTAVELINGKTLNLRTTGSQTDVGQSDNTYEYDWGKPDDWGESASTAKKYNYKLTPGTIGKLTVYLSLQFDPDTEDAVTGMPDAVKASDVDDEGNVTAAIPSDEPAREHYGFVGWAKTSGSETADYQPGDEITITDDMVTDGVAKLYAVWKIDRHTVTFKDDDGTVISEKQYDYGTPAGDIEIPADPSKPDTSDYTYTFNGWDAEPADVTEDAVYTATYTKEKKDKGGDDSEGSDPEDADDDSSSGDDDSDSDSDDTDAAAGGSGKGGGNGKAAGTNGAGAAVWTVPADLIAQAEGDLTDDRGTVIEENETPAPADEDGAWSLVNLICAILTLLIGGGMAGSYVSGRSRGSESRSGKLAGIVPAIGSIAAFVLTEDMSEPMGMTDKWTPLMAVILVGTGVLAYLMRNKEAPEE